MGVFDARMDARVYLVRLALTRERRAAATLVEVTDEIVDSPVMRRAAAIDGLTRDETYEQVAISACSGELSKMGRLVSDSDRVVECRRVMLDELLPPRESLPS